MTSAYIREEFLADVSRPGKFEGESPWVPYFWAQVLDGDGEVFTIEDIDFELFRVDAEEAALFHEDELKTGDWVALYEDGQGFVRGFQASSRQYLLHDLRRWLGIRTAPREQP